MAKKEKKRLSIMIIEDEQDILLLYKDYLLSRGHNVVATSTTANEILSDYDRIRPDVAIIDFKKLTAINKTIRWYDEFPTSNIDGLFVITPSYKVVPADNPFGYNMEEQLTQLKLATMKSGKLEEVRAPYGLLIYPINYGKILLVLIIISASSLSHWPSLYFTI